MGVCHIYQNRRARVSALLLLLLLRGPSQEDNPSATASPLAAAAWAARAAAAPAAAAASALAASASWATARHRSRKSEEFRNENVSAALAMSLAASPSPASQGFSPPSSKAVAAVATESSSRRASTEAMKPRSAATSNRTPQLQKREAKHLTCAAGCERHCQPHHLLRAHHIIVFVGKLGIHISILKTFSSFRWCFLTQQRCDKVLTDSLNGVGVRQVMSEGRADAVAEMVASDWRLECGMVRYDGPTWLSRLRNAERTPSAWSRAA